MPVRRPELQPLAEPAPSAGRCWLALGGSLMAVALLGVLGASAPAVAAPQPAAHTTRAAPEHRGRVLRASKGKGRGRAGKAKGRGRHRLPLPLGNGTAAVPCKTSGSGVWDLPEHCRRKLPCDIRAFDPGVQFNRKVVKSQKKQWAKHNVDPANRHFQNGVEWWVQRALPPAVSSREELRGAARVFVAAYFSYFWIFASHLAAPAGRASASKARETARLHHYAPLPRPWLSCRRRPSPPPWCAAGPAVALLA